jgi:hypothetical protein
LSGFLNNYHEPIEEQPTEYNPFVYSTDTFAYPNNCDMFTDAFAESLAELLPTCAPFFDVSPDSELVQCAWAGSTVSEGEDGTSGDYASAWFKVIDCNQDIPPQCLTGDGIGTLDTLLSLLPMEVVNKLKKGHAVPIQYMRIMIPADLNNFDYFDWKRALMQDVLSPLYYLNNGEKTVDGKNTGVALRGFKLGIKQYLFAPALINDIYYAVYAVLIVVGLMWFYTNSLIVTLLSFGEILSSLGLGYFFYYTVLRLPHFPFMNAITIFLAVGIGADDVFVYVDSWRLSRKFVPEEPELDSPLPREKWYKRILRRNFWWPKRPNQHRTTLRLAYSLNHAGMSTFVTSFTTSAAFLANIMNNIISVKCFGLYAALVVLSDYVLMITFLPAICVIFDDAICGVAPSRIKTLLGMLPVQTSEYAGEAPAPVAPSRLSRYASILLTPFEWLSAGMAWVFSTGIPTALLGPEKPNSGNRKYLKGKRYFLQVASSLAFPLTWTAAFCVFGMIGVVVAFVSPGLTLPTSPTYQLFDITNPIEAWDIEFSTHFATASVESINFYVDWYFGFKDDDNADSWDPTSGGTTVTYDLKPYAKESQKFYRAFDAEMRAAPWYKSMRNNWWELFSEYIQAPCCECPASHHNCNTHCDLDGDCFGDDWCWQFYDNDPQCRLECGEQPGDTPSACCGYDFNDESQFPLDPDEFHTCLDQWTENNGMGPDWQGIYYDRYGKLAGIKLGVETNLKFSAATSVTKEFWDKVEAFTAEKITNNDDIKGTGFNRGWAISQLTLYDVQLSLASGVQQTLLVSLLTAFLTLLATTRNLPITVAGMLTITGILGSTIAILVEEGWRLSILESVVFSVAVGLSIDFCVHYSWSILLTIRRTSDPREIVTTALTEMGPSVLMGASTTLIAGFILLLCETMFFLRFGVFLIVCMSLSWFWSSFFLMALVAVLPESILTMSVGGKVLPGVSKAGVNGSVVLSQLDDAEDDGVEIELATRQGAVRSDASDPSL